jgi:hypothetical protein
MIIYPFWNGQNHAALSLLVGSVSNCDIFIVGGDALMVECWEEIGITGCIDLGGHGKLTILAMAGSLRCTRSTTSPIRPTAFIL